MKLFDLAPIELVSFLGFFCPKRLRRKRELAPEKKNQSKHSINNKSPSVCVIVMIPSLETALLLLVL